MTCFYCEEPMTVEEITRAVVSSLPWGEACWTHQACAVRQVVGSVAHQERRCPCYGGTAREEDEALSKRQAAEAALAYWRAHGPWQEMP
jgi:hypothetical protein